MNIKNLNLFARLTAGALVGSLLLTSNVQARTLFYGMEKQVGLHSTQNALKTKMLGESSQRFYGGKATFRIEPKVKGATLGLNYNLLGSKTLSKGEEKIDPTAHGAFIDVGYKSSTRARLVSTVFSLGVGNIIISGDRIEDGKKTNFSTESTPAAKGAVTIDRKFGRFSPWSIQFAAEAIRLLESSGVIDQNIYSTSVGIGYRF